MSEDPLTQVTSESWFERIKGAFGGVIIGLLMFIAAFPVLWLNEGNAVRTAKALTQGRGSVVHIAAETVDPANEGKLVHVTGLATTDQTLEDSTFAIKAQGLRLSRNVQVYLWQEKIESTTEKKLGGGTETTKTPSYSKVWSSKLISSSDFMNPQGHENPTSLAFEAAHSTADNVTLGAFKLTSSQVGRIENAGAITLTDDSLAALPAGLKRSISLKDGQFYYRYGSVQVPSPALSQTTDDGSASADGSEPKPVVVASPAVPTPVGEAQVGDMKIGFQLVSPQPVSIVAAQSGDSFAAFSTPVGKPLDMLHSGERSIDQMFDKAESDNTMFTWIFRGVGFALMFIGVNLVLRPLSVIGDVIPFVGSLIGMGASLVALGVSVAFAALTIAVAWVAYRPLIGIPLVILAVAAVAMLVRKMRRSPAPVTA